VKGTVEQAEGTRTLTRVGITCALCHSTVDDSVAPGVGRRLDGWANVDLNPGAIIAASPAVPEAAKAVYNSWGPGKYDPRFSIDGLSTPVVIPPAYGLAGVGKETYTGDGDVSYWNNYVAVTQMGGQGVFVDPRLGVSVVRTPDRVHGKLPALLDYELSLPTPAPPAGSYDPELALAGELVFHTTGRCAECHKAPFYTDANDGVLHDAAEVGQNPAYAARTVTGMYRTTPLRGLWQHAPYFHDGSAATLSDVVEHYDGHLELGLTEEEKVALVEFLKTL
jgi:mono/diheme cytochrome c family protein